MDKQITYSVFTKPWKTQSIDELGRLIRSLGFDGIEFPLREGFQVEPKDAEKGLPELASRMEDYGLKITSVASSTDEKVFAGCAKAGIPIIRIMISIDPDIGYMESEARAKKELDSIIPLCERYGVRVGIQHHYGWCVQNSMGLLHLIEDYDPKYIGAIWDAAHSGLAGEEPEMGLDAVWSHLCMVNLKNAFYRQVNGPEADEAKWERYFTTGRYGLGSWKRISKYLKNRGYKGVVCLTAEYTEEEKVNEYIAQDIAYAKSLFEKEGES